jgi:hypothetical protein
MVRRERVVGKWREEPSCGEDVATAAILAISIGSSVFTAFSNSAEV